MTPNWVSKLHLFGCAPRGWFLKIISVGIPTYAGMKIGFHADVSPRETGFRAGVGRYADWNNLFKKKTT